MKKIGLIGMIACAAVIARAEPLLPTADGTVWQYESTEELGGPAAAAPTTVPSVVSVGRQTFDGKEFLKFETRTDDVLTKTELMTFDEHGLVCHVRGGKDGRIFCRASGSAATGKARDRDIGVGIEKERDRITIAPWRVHDPVRRRHIDVIAPAHQAVADVAEECAR